MPKPQYSKPTSTLDLEERQKDGYVPPAQLSPGVDPDVSDNGFVGVDPIYQNFANETERPGVAEKGAEAKVEANWLADEVDTSQGATDAGESSDEDDDDEDQTTPDGNTSKSPPAGTTPPSGSSNS